jgi:hypothetical protein
MSTEVKPAAPAQAAAKKQEKPKKENQPKTEKKEQKPKEEKPKAEKKEQKPKDAQPKAEKEKKPKAEKAEGEKKDTAAPQAKKPKTDGKPKKRKAKKQLKQLKRKPRTVPVEESRKVKKLMKIAKAIKWLRSRGKPVPASLTAPPAAAAPLSVAPPTEAAKKLSGRRIRLTRKQKLFLRHKARWAARQEERKAKAEGRELPKKEKKIKKRAADKKAPKEGQKPKKAPKPKAPVKRQKKPARKPPPPKKISSIQKSKARILKRKLEAIAKADKARPKAPMSRRTPAKKTPQPQRSNMSPELAWLMVKNWNAKMYCSPAANAQFSRESNNLLKLNCWTTTGLVGRPAVDITFTKNKAMGVFTRPGKKTQRWVSGRRYNDAAAMVKKLRQKIGMPRMLYRLSLAKLAAEEFNWKRANRFAVYTQERKLKEKRRAERQAK